jgi:hypothetical protein
MSENKELALLPARENAVQVFSATKGLDPYLAHIRAEIDSFTPDVSTKKGRDAIASIAYKVAKSKTALDALGKELVAELKEIPAKIDAERKRMRDLLDLWKDEVRKPLTDFELADKARVDEIKARIESLSTFKVYGSGGEKQIYIDELKAVKAFVVDDSLGEFQLEASKAKEAAIAYLERYIADREKYEAEQAELSKLRAEAAAREQKEREAEIARVAAENAIIEEQRKADAERQKLKDEQEKKDRENQLEIERVQREKLEAENELLRQKQKSEDDARIAKEKAEKEKNDAIEAERQRVENERLEAIRQQQELEKNRAHVGQKRKEAKESLMLNCGLSEEAAKAIVLAISNDKIINVKITY